MRTSLSINIISSVNAMNKVQEKWDAFASNYGDNPYFLCRFIEKYSEYSPQGSTLQLVLGQTGYKIAGIAPLVTRERFGMRIATFALPPHSSDFLIEERFKEEFIDRVLLYVFDILKCRMADLTFPTDSSSLNVLQQICQTKGIYFATEPYIGRRVLEVRGNWSQFENTRGGNFRRRFRKMQNKLDKAGLCRVTCVGWEEKGLDALSKMLNIDRLSWKETWRLKRRRNEDPDIAFTWEGAECVSRTNPNLRCMAWFLELNSNPIAYAIVLQHKQTAIIAKTSYDAHYRRYYPGMYLINAALRTLFDSGCVRNVDFVTDMPFMEAWTDLCRGRVRVLAGKGILSTTALSFYQNRQLRKIMNTMPYQLLSAGTSAS